MKFIFGEEEYLVNIEIKKYLNQFDIHPNVYDETSSIDNILMDISTVSMFNNNKLIVVKDHKLLTDNSEGDLFLKEFKKINSDGVHLIFAMTSNMKKSNKFISFLLQNAEVKEIQKISSKQLPQIIKQIVEENGGDISNSAIIKLTQKLPLNLRMIVNEVKKLLLENKNISDEQVDKSIENYYSEDYFALSNAIVDGDNYSIIKYYNEKIGFGEQPISIIGQIASTLNLAVMISNYKKQGFSINEISDTLKIHIFRIKKANNMLLESSAEKIEDLSIQLSNLDSDIKTGKIDGGKGLDRFILHLIK